MQHLALSLSLIRYGVDLLNSVNNTSTVMGTRERRDREREEIRAKILDAARDLFASQGYEAVSMRKIAEAIEYSPTAIYVHFDDKADLMRELCIRDFEGM